MNKRASHSQGGFLLIEALVAILIFSLGILVMLAMGGTAIASQSDARYRTDAARLTDDMANMIALSVVRTNETAFKDSLNAYQHQPSGATCNYSGDASAAPAATAWVSKVKTTGPGLPGLPGTTDAGQQILVDTSATGFNRVQITVCWKEPNSSAAAGPRHHTLVTYVN